MVIPGAADPDAGCAHGRSWAMSILADADVDGVPRGDAAWFRQCVKPDQKIVIRVFWGVMPQFRLDFRPVLVETDDIFADGLLMHL